MKQRTLTNGWNKHCTDAVVDEHDTEPIGTGGVGAVEPSISSNKVDAPPEPVVPPPGVPAPTLPTGLTAPPATTMYRPLASDRKATCVPLCTSTSNSRRSRRSRASPMMSYSALTTPVISSTVQKRPSRVTTAHTLEQLRDAYSAPRIERKSSLLPPCSTRLNHRIEKTSSLLEAHESNRLSDVCSHDMVFLPAGTDRNARLLAAKHTLRSKCVRNQRMRASMAALAVDMVATRELQQTRTHARDREFATQTRSHASEREIDR